MPDLTIILAGQAAARLTRSFQGWLPATRLTRSSRRGAGADGTARGPVSSPPGVSMRCRSASAGGDHCPVQPHGGIRGNVASHSLAEELLARTTRREIARGSAAYFEPIASTKGLANLVGGAVGDLLTEDVDPKSLLEAAERSGSPSLMALGAIYKEYSYSLSRGNWTHPTQMAAAAADAVRAGAMLPGTVMLDGFHVFRGTEMALLESLADRAEGRHHPGPICGDSRRA